MPRSLSRTLGADEAHTGSRPAPELVTAGAARLPRPAGRRRPGLTHLRRGVGRRGALARAAAAGGLRAPLQVRREVASGARYSPSTFFVDSAAAVVAAAAAPGAASATAAPGAAALAGLLGEASGTAGGAAAAAVVGTGGAAGAGLAVLVSGASLMVPGVGVGCSAALGLTAPKMAPPKF